MTSREDEEKALLGRIPGHTCGHGNLDHFGSNPPARTPGPLGHSDAADPNLAGEVADSPVPLGHDDHAERFAREYPRWIGNRRPDLPLERETPAMDSAKLGEQLRLRIGTTHRTIREDIIKATQEARRMVRTLTSCQTPRLRPEVGGKPRAD